MARTFADIKEKHSDKGDGGGGQSLFPVSLPAAAYWDPETQTWVPFVCDREQGLRSASYSGGVVIETL